MKFNLLVFKTQTNTKRGFRIVNFTAIIAKVSPKLVLFCFLFCFCQGAEEATTLAHYS